MTYSQEEQPNQRMIKETTHHHHKILAIVSIPSLSFRKLKYEMYTTKKSDHDDRDERSSNTVRISGLSDADRIHRIAMRSMSSSAFGAPSELPASAMCRS